MSESALLAFHIGPVQEFIATARRTQDWWMGSWLLSHLSRTALSAAEAQGAQLLLPKQSSAQSDAAMAETPNHFLVRVPSERVEAAANASLVAANDRWRQMADGAKAVFFGDVDAELWRRQIDTFLEIFWAAVPNDGSKSARNLAQGALDARKRLRNFSSAEEPHLKCSLCGARQEISGQTNIEQARKWWVQLVRRHSKREHLKKLRIRETGNERLCSVCAVKRSVLASETLRHDLDKYDGHFPSTSNVAAAVFKKRLLESGRGQAELAGHVKVLRDDLLVPTDKIERECLPGLLAVADQSPLPKELRDGLLQFDGSFFYAETFNEQRWAAESPGLLERLNRRISQDLASDLGVTESEARLDLGSEFDENVAAEVSRLINRGAASARAVYGAVRSDNLALNIRPPAKFFAALKMDGDHMGKFFARADTAAAEAMSEKLAHFASTEAGRIVTSHLGRLIYAGGDDGLALLPLETVLPCANELQAMFRDTVQQVQLSADVPRPTPSIGIALAHHTAPLDGVLSAMNHAESAAKQEYGRNAICVYVLKRSGAELRVGSHWSDDGATDAMGVCQLAVDLIRREAVSGKFSYAVAAEAAALDPLPLEARIAEVGRLGKRHAGDQADAERVVELVARLCKWADMPHGDGQTLRRLGLEEVALWLLLARFIASGGAVD